MSGRQAFHPFLLARRGSLAVRVLAVAFAALGLQFFRLQVLQHSQYQLRSESNRLRPVPLPAPRGLILDRHGQVIAANVPGYAVSLVAGSSDSLRRMLERLGELVELDAERVQRILERHRRMPFQPALVIKDAPFRLVSRLEERRVVLPGLVIQTEPKRYYPDSAAVAHLVGYVSEVTEQELASPAFQGRRLGSMVGKVGLERQYEDWLKGDDGMRFVEADALGRVIREEGAPSLPTEQGKALRTTIDLDLQRFVARIYPRQYRGAILAMDPRSGAILALYSHPSYDPNAFVGGMDPVLWRALTDDPARPLLNRAIGTRYPPGSTFKLAIALMALERGLAGVGTHMPVPCRGSFQFGNRAFRCWRESGHGSLDLLGAIVNSCNVYFYQLGLRVGVEPLLLDAGGFGFGEKSGVDLPGELISRFPESRAYYDRVYGRGRWTSAVALNLAIGQGENAQTLINMVRFYAALSNGGHVPVPYLVTPSAQPAHDIGIPDSTLLILRRGLLAVVEQGTARGARLASIRLGGKTGTAQNPHGQDHGWFLAYAPADEPAIVVGGIFEFGEHGTTVAPYVARIIEHYLLGSDPTDRRAEVVRLGLPRDSAPRDVPLDSAPLSSRGATRAPGSPPRGSEP